MGRLLREKRFDSLRWQSRAPEGSLPTALPRYRGAPTTFCSGWWPIATRQKRHLLGVSHALLERYGPVSKEVAEQMAVGVRASSGALIGIATTGIAGPTGGTPETPVGRVFIALATEALREVKQYDFIGDRHGIKLIASEEALDRVRRYLLGI